MAQDADSLPSATFWGGRRAALLRLQFLFLFEHMAWGFPIGGKGILKRAENVQGPIKLSKDGASPLEDLGQGLVGDVRWWSIPYLVLSTVLKFKIQNSTFKTLILKGFLKFRFPSIMNFENTSVNLKGQKEGYLGHDF